jgi:hypothetical protein
MHTITHTYPDGTRARYTLAPGSIVPLQLAALKPLRKPRIGADKRAYPKWTPDMSTADYVRQYFALNTASHKRITAYPSHVNHLALYAPLPDRPAPFYMGVDSVEVDE